MRFPLLSKVLAMGLVVLLLCLVLLRIDGLVHERRLREAQAGAGIEQSLAGAQTLLGPLLQRQCVEQWDVMVGEGRKAVRETASREMLLVSPPVALQVDGALASEPRHRGLFKLNGWAASLTLRARWQGLAELQPRREHAGSRLRCDPIVALLSVSDVRGLRSARVQVDGETLTALPGTAHPRFSRGLHADLGAPRSDRADDALTLVLTLDLIGTSRLAVVPAAGDTQVQLRSDWPHPSFAGRFLPSRRDVHAQGFDARWSVNSLASPAAADVAANGELCGPAGGPAADDTDDLPVQRPSAKGNVCLDTLGVALIDPVNPYVLTDRATKYALLFIVLTFASVALTEVLARRPVHPVQYTLVGLALALFYLLLLSLSEHLPFGTAYAVASAACVVLLGWYARHMLATRRAGASFGVGIAALYGFLWVLLQMENKALVIGSLALFGMLAAVMALTRRVDWYALFARTRTTTGAGVTP